MTEEMKPTRSIQRRVAAQKGLPAPDFSPEDKRIGELMGVKKALVKTLTSDEILGLIPAQALIDFDRAKEVLQKTFLLQRDLDHIYYTAEAKKAVVQARREVADWLIKNHSCAQKLVIVPENDLKAKYGIK